MSVVQTLKAKKAWVLENFLVLPALAAAAIVYLTFDRRDPFEYIDTTISPPVAIAGQPITIHRSVRWYRQCEGEAWTEIVGPDRIVNVYDRGVRYPSELGHTTADRQITLSKSMPDGTATYRGSIRFHSCGLTSRVMPISIQYQEVNFEVRHAP